MQANCHARQSERRYGQHNWRVDRTETVQSITALGSIGYTLQSTAVLIDQRYKSCFAVVCAKRRVRQVEPIIDYADNNAAAIKAAKGRMRPSA